jgi:hypothetical protein
MKGLCFVEPFYKIFIIVLYVYVHMYKHDKTIEFSYIIFKPKQIHVHVFLFFDLMGLPCMCTFKLPIFKLQYNMNNFYDPDFPKNLIPLLSYAGLSLKHSNNKLYT